MILVDDRIGSADLIGFLRHWSVPCQMERLEFGDACFTGNGAKGPLAIGIEVKKVHDALQCMTDGRFAGHQLPGLVRTYDRVWVVLEGKFTVDFGTGLLLADGGRRRGALSSGSRRFMYRDLSNWQTSMEVCANIRFRRTTDRVETARFLADLHGWFGKPFTDHKAHLALHDEAPDYAQFAKPSLARMVAAQLPGVGYKKSLAVVQKFGTVAQMVVANEDEWAEIDGIGEVLAKRIWEAIRK
jgi:ERCC4-type nuclease